MDTVFKNDAVTKLLGFENLLSNPSLNKDSDQDGVVDGWHSTFSGDVEGIHFFNDAEKCQNITISSSTGSGRGVVYTPVSEGVNAGTEYVISVYAMVDSSTTAKPRLRIVWSDDDNNQLGDSSVDIEAAEEWGRYSLTATAPSGTTKYQIQLSLDADEMGQVGTVGFKNAQLERSRSILQSPSLTTDEDGDGVADNWEKNTDGNATSSFSVSGGQRIDITESTAATAEHYVYQRIGGDDINGNYDTLPDWSDYESETDIDFRESSIAIGNRPTFDLIDDMSDYEASGWEGFGDSGLVTQNETSVTFSQTSSADSQSGLRATHGSTSATMTMVFKAKVETLAGEGVKVWLSNGRRGMRVNLPDTGGEFKWFWIRRSGDDGGYFYVDGESQPASSIEFANTSTTNWQFYCQDRASDFGTIEIEEAYLNKTQQIAPSPITGGVYYADWRSKPISLSDLIKVGGVEASASMNIEEDQNALVEYRKGRGESGSIEWSSWKTLSQSSVENDFPVGSYTTETWIQFQVGMLSYNPTTSPTVDSISYTFYSGDGVEAGKDYTFSFEAVASGISYAGAIDWLDASGSLVDTTAVTGSETEWTGKTVTATAPTGSYKAVVKLAADVVTAGATGYVQFRNASLSSNGLGSGARPYEENDFFTLFDSPESLGGTFIIAEDNDNRFLMSVPPDSQSGESFDEVFPLDDYVSEGWEASGPSVVQGDGFVSLTADSTTISMIERPFTVSTFPFTVDFVVRGNGASRVGFNIVHPNAYWSLDVPLSTGQGWHKFNFRFVFHDADTFTAYEAGEDVTSAITVSDHQKPSEGQTYADPYIELRGEIVDKTVDVFRVRWAASDLGSDPYIFSNYEMLFDVPEVASSASISMDVDMRNCLPTERLVIWDGGSSLGYVDGGEKKTITSSGLRRGGYYFTFSLRHDPEVLSNTVIIDNISISWEEVPPPSPPEISEEIQKVYTLDFEEERHDPFFTIVDKAPGYDYGYVRRYWRSKYGYYSWGPEVTDVSNWMDDENSPPTIPDNTRAGGEIHFRVPLAAIEPRLTFNVLYLADNYDATGRIILNGETLWERSSWEGDWEEVSVELSNGVNYTLTVEFDKGVATSNMRDDSVYLDHVVVTYNVPERPYMFIGTQPTTEIQTETKTHDVTEGFETENIRPDFNMENPATLRTGGGPSTLPEAGWLIEDFRGNRNDSIALPSELADATKMLRGDNYGTPNEGEAMVSFTISVPYGVRNAYLEWWNIVEAERDRYLSDGTNYSRLFEEYRIWVNGSLWREFDYCLSDMESSVKVEGKNAYACPWGRWWKETLPLQGGRSYTVAFEHQRDAGDSSPLHGRNFMAITKLRLYWETVAGTVQQVPSRELIRLDGSDGYYEGTDKGGREMAPLQHAEYNVYGQPGAVYQFTRVDARDVDIPIWIRGNDANDVREKVRKLVNTVANQPISLWQVYPEGTARMLSCRYSGGLEATRENMSEHGFTWKKMMTTYRAFDPFWFGENITVQTQPNGLFTAVDNSGDVEAWPVIMVHGNIDDPVVELTDPDDPTNVFGSFAIEGHSVAEGNFIIVDTRPGRKTVTMEDGETSLYRFLTGQFFSLPPGKYGVNMRSASGGSTTNSFITIQFREAFWGV